MLPCQRQAARIAVQRCCGEIELWLVKSVAECGGPRDWSVWKFAGSHPIQVAQGLRGPSTFSTLHKVAGSPHSAVGQFAAEDQSSELGVAEALVRVEMHQAAAASRGKKTWTTKEHLETVTATRDGGAFWQVALIQPTENPDKIFNQVQYCQKKLTGPPQRSQRRFPAAGLEASRSTGAEVPETRVSPEKPPCPSHPQSLQSFRPCFHWSRLHRAPPMTFWLRRQGHKLQWMWCLMQTPTAPPQTLLLWAQASGSASKWRARPQPSPSLSQNQLGLLVATSFWVWIWFRRLFCGTSACQACSENSENSLPLRRLFFALLIFLVVLGGAASGSLPEGMQCKKTHRRHRQPRKKRYIVGWAMCWKMLEMLKDWAMSGIRRLFHDFHGSGSYRFNALCSGSIGIILRARKVVAFVLPRQG